MSERVLRGATFTTRTGGAPSGLVGTIGVRVVTEDGAPVIPRTTDGIIEVVPGSGVYRAALIAPEEPGIYVLLWDDGVEFSEDEDLTVVATAPDAPDSVIPGLGEVGALLRHRTVDEDGRELGIFTTETQPTSGEVESLIGRAYDLLLPRLGVVPERLLGTARAIVALRAAMLVETTCFAQDVERGESVYTVYAEELKDALTAYEAVRAGDSAQQNSSRRASLRVKTLLSDL